MVDEIPDPTEWDLEIDAQRATLAEAQRKAARLQQRVDKLQAQLNTLLLTSNVKIRKEK